MCSLSLLFRRAAAACFPSLSTLLPRAAHLSLLLLPHRSMCLHLLASLYSFLASPKSRYAAIMVSEPPIQSPTIRLLEEVALKTILVLPEEVVIEILKRLPVVMVSRCMCVCKSWHSLIRSNYFVSAHLEFQKAISDGDIVPKTSYPFYYNSLLPITAIDSNSEMGFKFYSLCDDGFTFRQIGNYDCPVSSAKRVVGYCDGIVCLYSRDKNSRRRWFTLWNVSLKKHIEVDFPNECPQTRETNILCGFGCDASGNDYKIILLVYLKGYSYVRYVYSLITRFWRRISTPPYSTDSTPVIDGVVKVNFILPGKHLRGVIHWAMWRAHTEPPSSSILTSSILTFNLADEKFGEISLPDLQVLEGYEEEDRLCWSCSEYSLPITTIKWHGEDCLAVLPIDPTSERLRSTWIMEKYDTPESWTNVTTISRNDISSLGLLHPESWTKVATISRDDISSLGLLHQLRINGQIVVTTGSEGRDLIVPLDPQTQESEFLRYLSSSNNKPLYYLGNYVESLLLSTWAVSSIPPAQTP